MLRAILFDAAGTLIYLPRPVGAHYREVAARFGMDLPADGLDRAFRQAWKEMPVRPATPDGGPRPDDDRPWWRDLVDRVLAQTLPPDRREDFDRAGYFDALYVHFAQPGVWAAFPDVEPTLVALRARGLTLAVASNFDRRLPTVLGHLGLSGFFQAVVLSSEVGADKPHPRVFQRALAAVGVGAGEALHVGDDPVKDGGAEAAGLRVFHLDRPARGLAALWTALERGEFA